MLLALSPETEDSPCPTCAFAKKPTPNCYTEALKHQVLNYRRLPQELRTMKGCLASGFPFIFGFTCFSSLPFDSTTGEIPLPTAQDHVIGGHAVLAVGYDDAAQLFTIRNSWGSRWGKGGYGFMPYSYLLDGGLADDFWTIRTIE